MTHSGIACPDLASGSTEKSDKEQQDEQHQRLQQIVIRALCKLLSQLCVFYEFYATSQLKT